MEKKLKVKYSSFQSPLTYNEWAKQYKVSSMYQESTPYYQGNLTSQEPQRKSVLYQSVEDLYTRGSLYKFVVNKIKNKYKKQWQEKTS